MNEPMIVVYPRGQLSAKDKERLTKNGILAIEADTPKDVVQLRLAAPLIATDLTGDAIVRAALESIASQGPQTSGGSITAAGLIAHSFVSKLAASLKAGAA